MGRHSAPDSAESDERPAGVAVESFGRHAQAEVAAVPPEQGLELLEEAAERPSPPQLPPPRSDLALLRERADVRARCVAALVAPIAVYFAVLAVIGRMTLSTVLIWCAIPLVTAGVLFGLFLDAGHRKYRVSGSPDRP